MSAGSTSSSSIDMAWAASIVGLRELLAALIDAMWGLPVGSAKMLRLSRTILRMIRIVISVEVAHYKSVLKNQMLADPAWRGRVYADLGGMHAMDRWRQRFGAGAQTSGEAQGHGFEPDRFQGHDSPNNGFPNHDSPHNDAPKSHNRYKTDSAGQFRLAPLPRGFQSRADTAARVMTGERQNPFSQPIPLSPDEFPPPAHDEAAGYHGGASYNDEMYCEAEPPPNTEAGTETDTKAGTDFPPKPAPLKQPP